MIWRYFERMMSLKIAKAVGALLLCVLMAGCSLVQVNNDRVVVAVVNGESVNLTDYSEYANVLINNNGIDVTTLTSTQTEVMTNQILDALVNITIQEQKMVELGLPISDDDFAQATKEIDESMESQYQQLVAAYQEDEEIENPEEAARTALDNAYAQRGYNREMAILERVETNRLNKLYEHVTGDVTITDEEVVAYFDNLVATQKETYQNNLAQFRTDVENGAAPFYTPAGFINVKHILITMDEASVTEISTLRTSGNNDGADALRNEKLLTIQEKADEVLAKVNAGEDFDGLIEQYGEDPGMQAEPYNETGYTTYSGNDEFMQEFQDAAMTLTADGDVSGLVATDYGYHILKRISSVEESTTTFDEMDLETITTQALTSKQQARYQELLAEWIEASEVKLYPKKVAY